MAWAAVAGAAISVGGSLLSGRKASKQADAATQLAQNQQALAEKQYKTWESNYLPFELGLLDEAKNWDSPARIEQALGTITADTNAAFGNAKESLGSRLASFGLDPSRGTYASTFGKLEGDAARALVGAKNTGRLAIADQAFNRRYAMAGLGRGLMSGGAQGMQAGVNNAQQNAILAQSQANAGAQGAGILGNLAMRGINAFNTSPGSMTLTDPTLIPMQPGGGY